MSAMPAAEEESVTKTSSSSSATSANATAKVSHTLWLNKCLCMDVEI